MATLSDDICFLTGRALWETENLLRCIPPEGWDRRYDELPVWKYVYHMLYSMDRWFINPCDPDYRDPAFHREDAADLNQVPPDGESISRETLLAYFDQISQKLMRYVASLDDSMLAECPEKCGMSRLRLILGQFRHWHRHMGIVYGFLIRDEGKWPYVLNMNAPYPETPMPNFYETQV